MTFGNGKKFRFEGIPRLMTYAACAYALGIVIYSISPTFYYQYLSFDIDAILAGQVWRLITFVLQPLDDNFFLALLLCYVYYFMGNLLERMWGTRTFTIYYLTGIAFNAVGTIIVYVVIYFLVGVGISIPMPLRFVNHSMFLTLGAMFPELHFNFMMLIPVKGKYLMLFDVAISLYDIIDSFVTTGVFGGMISIVAFLTGIANFLIFYFTRGSGLSVNQVKRRMEFKRSYNEGERSFHSGQAGTIHRCCICGRTELDDPNLEFRFCSKCSGNKEYCRDHLFTHQHN